MTYEIVVRYNDSSLRGEPEVVDEGTLEEVKSWMDDYRLVYRDIGVIYYRKAKR